MTPTAVNFDVETQIHYGVISEHSVSPDAIGNVYDRGESLSYLQFVADVKADLRAALKDRFSDYKHGKETSRLDDAVEAAFDAISDDLNDGYECDQEQYLYEQDGYKISNSPSLVCLFIEKSPYYTYAAACSPCAPNAGDLDTQGGLKSYCLGHEWFDDDKAPYPVYDVATDQLVGAEYCLAHDLPLENGHCPSCDESQ